MVSTLFNMLDFDWDYNFLVKNFQKTNNHENQPPIIPFPRIRIGRLCH